MDREPVAAGPAGRLLGMMGGGYSNSLGVSCSHCHVTSDFAKDDKPQKQVTREMVGMVSFINDSLLKKIEGIQSENPGLNCGTCHNGRARPGFGPRAQGSQGERWTEGRVANRLTEELVPQAVGHDDDPGRAVP